jgi:hypothetical protein
MPRTTRRRLAHCSRSTRLQQDARDGCECSHCPRPPRRVPFRNMVYIGDGPSDVPCFSLVSRFGGRTYAIYKGGSDREYQNACDLRKQQRVEALGEADYSDGSHTAKWITKAVENIAEGIVRDRESIRGDELERPPGDAIKQVKMAYAGASFEPPTRSTGCA